MIRYILAHPVRPPDRHRRKLFFLLIASIADPVMAGLTGDTLLVGFWAFVDEVFSSDDPGPIVMAAFDAVGRLVFTLLVLPPLFVAILSEVIRARSAIWYGAATGVLTAAIPMDLRGSARVGIAGRIACQFRSRSHRSGRGAGLLDDCRPAFWAEARPLPRRRRQDPDGESREQARERIIDGPHHSRLACEQRDHPDRRKRS